MSKNPPVVNWPELKGAIVGSIRTYSVVSAQLMADCTQFILNVSNSVEERVDALDILTNTVMGMDEPTTVDDLEQFASDYNLLMMEG